MTTATPAIPATYKHARTRRHTWIRWTAQVHTVDCYTIHPTRRTSFCCCDCGCWDHWYCNHSTITTAITTAAATTASRNHSCRCGYSVCCHRRMSVLFRNPIHENRFLRGCSGFRYGQPTQRDDKDGYGETRQQNEWDQRGPRTQPERIARTIDGS